MEAFSFSHSRSDASDVTAYIAGGTDLMQLMKNNVQAPQRLIDLSSLVGDEITMSGDRLRLGALAKMADVVRNDGVMRQFPMISQALSLSASQQVRNMGTVGGNLLQRTRCGYFRDTGFACNKRVPGSGCPAIAGDSRNLAVLGTSGACIATHPSDLPVALMALDTRLEISDAAGKSRTIALADLYRLPGSTPHIETSLQPGDVIVAVEVPANRVAQNSVYLKVRDRTSFAFALVSAAVGLDVENGMVRDARVAMGGMGTMPWRLSHVEAALRGRQVDEALFARAAAMAAEGAKTTEMNRFKTALAPRVVLRALQTVSA